MRCRSTYAYFPSKHHRQSRRHHPKHHCYLHQHHCCQLDIPISCTHYPTTNITAIYVTSKVFNNLLNIAHVLVNVLKFIHVTLVAVELKPHIKVSIYIVSIVILNFSALSQAFFDHSWNLMLIILLKFL